MPERFRPFQDYLDGPFDVLLCWAFLLAVPLWKVIGSRHSKACMFAYICHACRIRRFDAVQVQLEDIFVQRRCQAFGKAVQRLRLVSITCFRWFHTRVKDVSIMEQRWLPCESLLPAFYSSAYMTIVPDVPTIQKCISSAWPPERRFSTKKWKMKIALVVALSQQTGAYILKWCAFNVDILELCTKSKPGNRTRTQKWLSVEQTLGMWKDHLYLAQRWPWAWRVTPNISNFTQKTHNHRNLLVGQKMAEVRIVPHSELAELVNTSLPRANRRGNSKIY